MVCHVFNAYCLSFSNVGRTIQPSKQLAIRTREFGMDDAHFD